MSFRSTYASADNAQIAIIGDYYTIAEALTACYAHYFNQWTAIHGISSYRDPAFQYYRGALSQWNGASRIYVKMPNGEWLHYDISELSR